MCVFEWLNFGELDSINAFYEPSSSLGNWRNHLHLLYGLLFKYSMCGTVNSEMILQIIN